MDDLSRLDGWASFVLGAFLAMLAGLKSFFSLKARVERAEAEGAANKLAITEIRTEIRQDMKQLNDKLDRLIDRALR